MMKIIRIILLALAMGLFAVNFWTIDYLDLGSGRSCWAYFRIAVAFFLVMLLVAGLRQDLKKRNR